jgi:multisubunit Na+/H+ antiporter MnhB subunit
MLDVIIIVLIVLMIIGALVAIETPNVLHAVISVGAVGFLLSIVFLFLSAPDLAITQIAVEIITLVLLLTTARLADREPDSDRWLTFGKLAALAMLILLAVLSAGMFDELPAFGQPVTDRSADAPSNTYLRDGLEQTGAANIVTAVLLDYRGYDTLGEATVLFCAVMGALTVLRRNAKQRPDEAERPNEAERPDEAQREDES